jgi:hypothetical protein
MPSAPRAERRLRRLVLPGLVALALASATAYPLCDLVFDCGCTWPLLGADAHCDVHRAGPPDCPVCTRPAVAVLFSGALLAAWSGIVWGVAVAFARARAVHSSGA